MEDPFAVDYEDILQAGPQDSAAALIGFLSEELPYAWLDVYLRTTPRPTNVVRMFHNEFRYMYDYYHQLERDGTVPLSPDIEDRVVAVYGCAQPPKEARDNSRMKGWLGPTTRTLGENTDKGHFIAHASGGGLAINLFRQRSDLNRGKSAAGKIYRQMERSCAEHPGTFCFNRALYNDNSNRPFAIEFGLLKQDLSLWVQRFENI